MKLYCNIHIDNGLEAVSQKDLNSSKVLKAMTMDWPNNGLIQNSSASITSDRQGVTVNKTFSELNS